MSATFGVREAFLCLAIGALAALGLVVSYGTARAVMASPPTVTCNGNCQTCLESEVGPGGNRCVKCGIDPVCLGNPGDPGMTSDFTEMLADHNKFRKLQCAAPLTWSPQLATAAQTYANTCPSNGQGGFNHDTNRGQVGENLFWGTRTSGTQAVQWWYDEISKYDFKKPAWSSAVGHFTQVVWKNSQQLGCGVAVCGNVNLWVCRYSPPGNWNVDKPGELASNVGCGTQPVAAGGGGGGGGGAEPAPAPAPASSKGMVAVLQAVDVYQAPGGDGNPIGTLEAPGPVKLVGACQDNWCHVQGGPVPGGDGWVYDGPDYDSLAR